LSDTRDERIELRATKDQKRLLVAAAASRNMDVTSYILNAVLPQAHQDVDQAERWRISADDAAMILDLLENPPVPNERVRRARAKSRRR